jgi:hypothetical protein
MIKHTYDPDAKALYVYLADPQERVGTLEVRGDIKFRRPGKIVPFNGTILLDFTEEGALAGVEVLGSCISENLSKPQPLSSAKVELKVKLGVSFDEVQREANSIYNSFLSTGVKSEVYFTFNDKLYISKGTYCEEV